MPLSSEHAIPNRDHGRCHCRFTCSIVHCHIVLGKDFMRPKKHVREVIDEVDWVMSFVKLKSNVFECMVFTGYNTVGARQVGSCIRARIYSSLGI